MTLRNLLIIALALAALSACGRRGALEAPGEPGVPLESQAPPVAASTAQSLAPSAAEETLLDPQSPGSQAPAGTATPAAPDRPFVLDPLL